MKELLVISALALAGAAPAHAGRPEVVQTYVAIGHAAFQDSLTTGQALQQAVAALIDAPSPDTLDGARRAWRAARVPYLQTEAFRFGNPVVDDWEGKVNAWPLDEGLIDYVDPSMAGASDENQYAALNVIAQPRFTLSGSQIDATRITPALLSDTLHEADAVEANVATGYHAIEFLLWGQDLHGTEAGAGERPWTDYAQGAACTNGNCDRRAEYLAAATDLLVSDLQAMEAAWQPDGAAAAPLLADPDRAIAAMLTGMGSLSYGELAGERMKLGLMLNDPEEEQDCFSDNTFNSHYYDGLGIRNVYLGHYTRPDGSTVTGESLSSLVAAADPAVDQGLRAALDDSVARLAAIKAAGDGGTAYDQMLAQGNDQGEALILAAVDALVAQTRDIERAVTALGLSQIGFEGSDSLDSPDAVFQ